MNTIIGLGQAGCAIATEFSKFPLYKNIFRLDTEVLEKAPNCIDILIAKQNNPEDYETKIISLKKYFKDIKGKVLFVVAGGGSVSIASLKILENLKSKCNISILYIRPDIEFLGANSKLKERLTFNVFQEYARSGLFERMFIVSNPMVEKAMGGVSVLNYNAKINQTIVSTFHMLNSFENMKPVTHTFSDFPIGTRISTIGLMDVRTNEEQMFYELDSTTDSVYYLAYNEDVLKEDTKLSNQVKNMIKNKIEKGAIRVSYGIFATNYSTAFVVCSMHSSTIQK